MHKWIRDFAPDVAATAQRFALAIILSLASTLLAIALTNSLFIEFADVWFRLVAGLSIAAVFAVAGVLYGESHAKSGLTYWLVAYGLPALAIGLMQVESFALIVAPMLAPISLLWLSLSSFTKVGQGEQREEIQNRFWWMNHRAIITAIVAGFGFVLIALGFVATERAMSVLFGIRASSLFYEYLLPFTGMFLTPVYWLSTIPRVSEYSEKEISEPDFLSRAIGFLGQFVLTPFLLIYALILLAYALQILISRALPEGMLSWMVLGFTIVGAANWLVLHPKFMHKRPLVKYFRRFWFWLTLVPIALYWLAVFVRIDAYGLTPDRIGLIAGGLWATALSLAFLSKKFADIRLIPGLALAMFLIWSVGPWNLVNLPQIHQAMRLDAAIYNATPATQTTGGPYEWTDETAAIARGAFQFLFSSAGDRERLSQVLSRHGITLDLDNMNSFSVLQELGLDPSDSQNPAAALLDMRTPNGYIFDASRTPFVLGPLSLRANYAVSVGLLDFKTEPNGFKVSKPGQGEKLVQLQTWLDRQSGDRISQPVLEFEFAGTNYRLVISSIRLFPETSQAPLQVQHIAGVLYGDRRPTEE
ncbi:MAG TPA: DUF4153 domain-containing protein [Devosia sp.]|nr:DUF4153 domain-containing protein [Devosia sp.]